MLFIVSFDACMAARRAIGFGASHKRQCALQSQLGSLMVPVSKLEDYRDQAKREERYVHHVRFDELRR
jgi:hypothetical protein